ncbi:methanol oxidation system protein MoxJ [Azospirillum halopraeferens]|uniref:methanol oxidation system protein MoxJ n=1 Tax=Azospirillum halopraeferens TaxID=34010 RepID=UPI0003FB27CC|nr:methanol oxidation system protein MoxJ [Azospirillum halopraeferens]
MPLDPSPLRSLSAGAIAAAFVAIALTGTAAAADPSAPVLRVCASTKGAPYTLTDGTGFENRIAAVVAEAMGRKAEFVWTDQPAIFLVRDMLDKGACDVLVGVDDGDPRMLTTAPYYRTGYAFITRADRGLTLSSWSDDDLLKVKRVAYQFHSPAEEMLKQTGLYEDNLIYQYSLINFSDRRNQYTQVPGNVLVSAVAGGEADAAVAFAPDVARYVKASTTPLTMTMIDRNGVTASGKLVPQQFDQSMGVRKDDEALRRELDAALVAAAPRIVAILRDEGIPVLQPSVGQ